MASSFLSFLSSYWIAVLITALLAYLVGSVDFAILVTRHYQKKDIRECGSGNAGMTNVMRSVGKKAGVLTFIGDVLKGAVAALGGYFIFKAFAGNAIDAQYIALSGAYIAGVFDMLGHIFPIYFGFKGGKGVATSVGIMAVTDFRVCLIVLAVFILVAVLTKYVSAGSVLGAFSFTVSTILIKCLSSANPDYFVAVSVISAFIIGFGVIIKHKANIKRLLSGTESKFKIKGE